MLFEQADYFLLVGKTVDFHITKALMARQVMEKPGLSLQAGDHHLFFKTILRKKRNDYIHWVVKSNKFLLMTSSAR